MTLAGSAYGYNTRTYNSSTVNFVTFCTSVERFSIDKLSPFKNQTCSSDRFDVMDYNDYSLLRYVGRRTCVPTGVPLPITSIESPVLPTKTNGLSLERERVTALMGLHYSVGPTI